MMLIKKINETIYEEFVSENELSSFYQSIEWMHVKQKEGRACELLGLFDDEKLVGVSLIIYLRVMKKFLFAYASRGFIYDYSKLREFKLALKNYFEKKKVIFIKIDPPIVLARYNKSLNKTENVDNLGLVNNLKKLGFKHFGFNMAAEAYQFRFVHKLNLKESLEEQLKEMSKSTRKNIELAKFKGVKSRLAKSDELDEVLRLFQYTIDRKEIVGFSKKFYEYLLEEYKDNLKMYIIYIDKNIYLNNLQAKLDSVKNTLDDLNKKIEHDHVGVKLTTQKEQALAAMKKYEQEIIDAQKLDNITNIASMLTITKYDEVVSLTSGMNNEYRSFCPKYVMYPEMVKDAINQKLKYVNFLGVKNIFDVNDKDRGIYEVKKGFGGETVEYIGEFDLPINNLMYKIYKVFNKIKGKK